MCMRTTHCLVNLKPGRGVCKRKQDYYSLFPCFPFSFTSYLHLVTFHPDTLISDHHLVRPPSLAPCCNFQVTTSCCVGGENKCHSAYTTNQHGHEESLKGQYSTCEEFLPTVLSIIFKFSCLKGYKRLSLTSSYVPFPCFYTMLLDGIKEAAFPHMPSPAKALEKSPANYRRLQCLIDGATVVSGVCVKRSGVTGGRRTGHSCSSERPDGLQGTELETQGILMIRSSERVLGFRQARHPGKFSNQHL